MQPQAAQARLIGVVENLFMRQEQPVLVILEDLHWVRGKSGAAGEVTSADGAKSAVYCR